MSTEPYPYPGPYYLAYSGDSKQVYVMVTRLEDGTYQELTLAECGGWPGAKATAQLFSAAPDLVAALTDGLPAAERDVSPLGWLATMLRSYKAEHDWAADDDPDATSYGIATCEKALADLRRALDKAEGREAL